LFRVVGEFILHRDAIADDSWQVSDLHNSGR
jgi:hypothetical protein